MPRITHDVLSLSRTCHVSAEMLESGMGPGLDQQSADLIGAILSSQQHLRRLMTRLGELAEAERLMERRPFRRDELLDLDTVLMAARLQWKTALEEANAHVETGALPECLVCAKLQDAFGELFSNSITYRDVRRPLEIEVHARRRSSKLVIEFLDNGPGWDATCESKLFQPLQRLTTRKDSYGLGLAIARTIVEASGGEIRAELRDTGSCFVIELPAD